MRVFEKENNIIVEDIEDFQIDQVLECGQCFHFNKLDEKEYEILAFDRYLHVIQNENSLHLFDLSMEEYNNIWKNYFDLERDYKKIKNDILIKDTILEKAINEKNGIRLLNQNFFETLISFIISQNKQIPHIKQIVNVISQRYGNEITINGEKKYTFPCAKRLVEVSEEELRECKVGFRAPYIVDACQKVYSGMITEDKLNSLNVDEARQLLMTIKGVGEKVANCVLLFSLGRREVFPVDVWMKRIMESIYFNKEVSKKEIEDFAMDRFGDLGGYVQQYLFFYGRDNNIGK